MSSNITSTKVTDEGTCELVNQSTSSLNQVFSQFKDNYSSDSLDKPLVPSKKFIIIPSTSTSTTSIDNRQSVNVSQARKPIKKVGSNVSLKDNLLGSDFKPQHPLLKADRFSSCSIKSNVSGIYLLCFFISFCAFFGICDNVVFFL